MDAEYYWNGESFAANTYFATCDKVWLVSNSGDKWHDCGTIAGYDYNVQMRASTSFGEFNQWPIAGAEVKFEFWINHDDTYYTTYINFDEMVWTETFSHGSDLVGQTEWKFFSEDFNLANVGAQ